MIKVIQGDTLNLTISVEGDNKLIEELYFSCKKLDIVNKLTKVNDTQYIITFSSEITQKWMEGNAFYDITAKLKDNQISTVVYYDEMRILKKENTINGN